MGASIRPRGKTFQLQYREKGYETVNATFDTEAEALEEVERIKARRKLALSEPDRKAERITLSDLLDEYQQVVTPGKKGKAREEARIAAWKKHPLAVRFLHLVRSADVSDYLVERRRAGVSDATIRLELMLLSAVFTYAIGVKRLRLEHPVSGMLDALRVGKSAARDRRLRPKEADYLYPALERIGPIHRPLAEWAVETAMRQGEILALTWSDVDTSGQRRVRVVADKAGGVNVWLPVSTRAWAILESLRPANDDSDTLMLPLFKVSQDRISRAFAEACAAGRTAYEADIGRPAPQFLSDLRFHDLRHEATSQLFERGMSRAEVLTITRHRTLAMLDRYTHLDHSENSAIVRKLG